MTAPDLTARSYHSDHGGYSNKCSICQSPFYGGKGRVNCAICKTVGEELARLRFALVAAERERDALRSDNNQAHEYLGGTDTIGLVDLAAVRAGELARAQELCETRRLYIAKMHKEQLERFKQGCAFCGAMDWFVTASGGHRCGSCGNIFDAPIIDEARTDG